MLTLTPNGSTSIGVTSDTINFADALLTSLEVVSTINCCSTEFSATITEFDDAGVCWYQKIIELEGEAFPINEISTFTVVTDNGLTTVELITAPTTFTILDGARAPTADMTALALIVNNWLTSNSINCTFTITFTTGIALNSVMTLQFVGIAPGFVPQTVVIEDGVPNTVSFSFDSCIGVTVADSSKLLLDGNLTILPALYGSTNTSILDGVYAVEVIATYSDDTIIRETACTLVDAVIKCTIPTLIQAGDFESHILYDGILQSNACITWDCDCSTACGLYKLLADKLTENLLLDANTITCGCS